MAAPHPQAAGAATPERPTAASLLREVAEVAVLAVILYVGISFAVQAVHVEGLSMFATLDNDDYLIANKIDYRLHAPQRGDIIILRPPTNNSTDFIKRVIALPGEKLLIRSGVVYIDGHRLHEPYLPEAWTQSTDWPCGGCDGTGMGPNVAGRHCVNLRQLLVDALDLAQQQLLVGEPECHAVGGLELQAETALGELLGARQLVRADLDIAQCAQLGHHGVHSVRCLLRLDPDVHADVTGVAVLLREAVHVVREAQALPDVQEQARAHPFAEHGVEEVQCVAVGMGVAVGARPAAEVGLLRVAPPDQDAWAGQRWRCDRHFSAIRV